MLLPTPHLQVPRYLIIVGLVVGCAGLALIGPTKSIITTPYELLISGTCYQCSFCACHIVHGNIFKYSLYIHILDRLLWLVILGVMIFGAGIPFALVPIYSDVYSM